MSERRPPKIAPYAFPESYRLPDRPAAAPPSVQDAHRQARFLLASDLSLFERAMNLQLTLAASAARKRTPETAALLGFWSRTFGYLADACVLLAQGSYPSCPPLLRAACDCVAAQRSLLAEGFREYEEWLAAAIGKDLEHAALAVDLGRFRAGSVLAGDERLGSAYRLLTDLTIPHFGSTVLQAAPDSSHLKLTIAFPDGGFHLGWAELVCGWLLLLADAQIETASECGRFEAGDETAADAARLRREIAEALASPRRCLADELPDGRRIIRNFRRAVSGAPRRVVI